MIKEDQIFFKELITLLKLIDKKIVSLDDLKGSGWMEIFSLCHHQLKIMLLIIIKMKIDLYESLEDLASAANYLKKSDGTEPWGVKVQLQKNRFKNFTYDARKPAKRVKDWVKNGVLLPENLK